MDIYGPQTCPGLSGAF